MISGLFALLDDIASIAKAAAASLDDVAVQAVKASKKAAGIVIDDAAVTPRYVVGFAASRELPIIGRIAWGSLKNKVLYLLPGALALSYLAPWAITPLLMLGGAYLCYEGYEKLHALSVPAAAPVSNAIIPFSPSAGTRSTRAVFRPISSDCTISSISWMRSGSVSTITLFVRSSAAAVPTFFESRRAFSLVSTSSAFAYFNW